jgi:hypothetical protein
MCFCESCRQAAKRDGVDVEGAASAAMDGLNAILSDKPLKAASPEDFVSQHPDLAAFVDWRCRQVTSLVAMLKQAAPCRVVVHRVGDRFMTATDWREVAGACDGLLAHCPYSDGDEAVKTLVEQVSSDTEGMNGVELGFSACSPTCPSAEALVKGISTAAKLGVRSVDIYNYGLLPVERMEWIRRASRYAQRESSGS